MTKQQAINDYITLYYGDIYNFKRELANGDKIAIRMDFLDYIDTLCKDGQITQKQFNSWTCPKGWY